jgi:hypothetical protein
MYIKFYLLTVWSLIIWFCCHIGVIKSTTINKPNCNAYNTRAQQSWQEPRSGRTVLIFQRRQFSGGGFGACALVGSGEKRLNFICLLILDKRKYHGVFLTLMHNIQNRSKLQLFLT